MTSQTFVMKSPTFLMRSSVKHFDRKSERVFNQTKHKKRFFLLALILGELYREFSQLKVKN